MKNKQRDGRIDINLYNGLARRVAQLENELAEKEAKIVKYVDKCATLQEEVEKLRKELKNKEEN